MKDKKLKLAVASGKGGVGKSMLVSSLAMLLAREYKVVAVDCDVDAPNLAIWLNEINKKPEKRIKISTSEKPIIDYRRCNNCGICAEKCSFEAIEMKKGRPFLKSYFCEGCGLCEIVCPQDAIKLRPVKNGKIETRITKYRFPLITGQLLPGETGSGKIVDEIKRMAEKFSYQIMLIDSAPGTGCPVISALKDVDFAILVTEPTPPGLSDLKRVLRVVDHFKIPWVLTINKWDINPSITKKLEKQYNQKIIGRISYDSEIIRAIANMTPVIETNLRAKKEIDRILQRLKRRLTSFF